MAAETTSLILDNGASSLKMGFSHEESPKLIPNCVTRSVGLCLGNILCVDP